MHIVLREAKLIDLDRIVSIHFEAFEGRFLTLLGRRFVSELYKNLINDTQSICLVAKNSTYIVGFVAGNLYPASYYKRLLYKNWHTLSWYAIPALFRRPFIVGRKLFTALIYRGESPKDYSNSALLGSIAVKAHAYRMGIGRMLMAAFCDTVKKAGMTSVYLITDNDGNISANHFYKQFGFVLCDSFQKPGHHYVNRYLLDLTDIPIPHRILGY